jgi:putative transposase
MKKARFSEEQIIDILKEGEVGCKVSELVPSVRDLRGAVLYMAQKGMVGREVSEMWRLRQLEEENRRLKSIVADQALDLRALKDVLEKTGRARGEAAAWS